MAWFTGTATDYRDFLSTIAEFASSDNVTVVAVAAGGAGYVVGDVITASGGTSTTAALFEVSAEAAGVVTELRVVNAGAYSVQPGNPVSTTGGTGAGLTLTLTFQTLQWAILRQSSQIFLIDVATITTPGTLYVVNDILTLDATGAGGTTQVTAATLRVDAVDGGGAITAISVETIGEYSVFDDAFTYAVTGGTGSGFEATVFVDGIIAEDQLILQGVGSGADEVFVGMRSYTLSATGTKNWELAGFTGFLSTSTWPNQPGISPGRFDVQGSVEGGAFFPMRDVSFDYWVSINGRKITMIAHMGANYHSAFLGFLDQFTTSTAWPYPMMIMSTSTDPDRTGTSSDVGTGGFPDPVSDSLGTVNGPGMVRMPSGIWENYRDAHKSGGSLARDTVGVVNSWPGAREGNTTLPTDDRWAVNGTILPRMESFIPNNIGDTISYRLEPTPNTGGSLSPIFPLTLVIWDQNTLIGQVPGVYWVYASRDGGSSVISEDTFTLPNGDRYRMFQNVSRTEVYNFFCIIEE